jgi:predicted dehydrogenase
MLRVVVFGAGWSARRLSAALPDDATVVASVHRSVSGHAAGPSAPRRLTYDQVVGFDDFDAALICTPPTTQVELARGLIERGKHLVVEKPVGLASKDVADLAVAARRAGVVVQVPYHLAFLPAVERLRTALATGEVGPVRHLTHRMFVPAMRRPEWLTPELSGGPVVETMVHGFHLAALLGGKVERATGLVEGSPADPQGAAAILRHAGSALSVLEVSWRATTGVRRGGLEVIADGGHLRVDRGTVGAPGLHATLRTCRGEQRWSHSDDLSFERFLQSFTDRCVKSTAADDLCDLDSAQAALTIAEEVGYDCA